MRPCSSVDVERPSSSFKKNSPVTPALADGRLASQKESERKEFRATFKKIKSNSENEFFRLLDDDDISVDAHKNTERHNNNFLIYTVDFLFENRECPLCRLTVTWTILIKEKLWTPFQTFHLGSFFFLI